MDIAIGVMVIIGGIICFLLGFACYRHSLKSLDWPTTHGTVVSSKVVHEIVETDNRYIATVEYNYIVRNKEYTGDKIGVGPVGSLPWIEEEKIKPYPVGAKVQVYYNPLDHSEAILEPGVKSGTIWWLVVPIIIIILGIIQLFFPFMNRTFEFF